MKAREDVLDWSLATLATTLRQKEISPVEVTQKLLKRIEHINPLLNAYITVTAEAALESATRAEADILAGNWKGPLHGIPVGLKDIIFTRNMRTTMGSALFRQFVPDYDAAVVEKLKQAGAIIIGKLNTHEFAYGPTGDRSCFGAVRNPHNISKMSGGSSSGSAAAVAAGLCYGALGTDTGGSIRNPSSMCGIVGLKPTCGRISTYGVFPLSKTLDHVGPMTRTVLDNALMFRVLKGYDPRDPRSVKHDDTDIADAEDFTRRLQGGISGGIVGIPTSFYFENIESEVEDKVNQAITIMNGLGAEIRPVDIPHIREISLAQQMVIKCEAFAVHKETVRKNPEKYDDEVKERLMTGATPPAYEYIQALEMRQTAIAEFANVLNAVDVIATPTIPVLPPDIGQREITIGGRKEHVRTSLTRLTGPTNLNGFPSISLPCGVSATGLPVGIQLIAKPFDEAKLYRFAYALEQEIAARGLMNMVSSPAES